MNLNVGHVELQSWKRTIAGMKFAVKLMSSTHIRQQPQKTTAAEDA
jgi:hypothetical protein